MWKYKVSCKFYDEFAGAERVVSANYVYSTKVCAEIAYLGLKACKDVVDGSIKVEYFFDQGEK